MKTAVCCPFFSVLPNCGGFCCFVFVFILMLAQMTQRHVKITNSVVCASAGWLADVFCWLCQCLVQPYVLPDTQPERRPERCSDAEMARGSCGDTFLLKNPHSLKISGWWQSHSHKNRLLIESLGKRTLTVQIYIFFLVGCSSGYWQWIYSLAERNPISSCSADQLKYQTCGSPPLK